MWLLIALPILALIPAVIAQSKGRSFAAWWIYGILLWIIALPHAIFATDLKAAHEAEERDRHQRAAAAIAADSKTCPRCAETIKRAALVCRFCGHEFAADAAGAPDPSYPTSSLGALLAEIEGRGCSSVAIRAAGGDFLEKLKPVLAERGYKAYRDGKRIAVTRGLDSTWWFGSDTDLLDHLREIAAKS